MSGLATTARGSGPDWALIHGWGLHGGIWTETAEALAADRRVTTVDLPGHGASRGPVPTTLRGAAAEVAASLPERMTLVGWSLGGLVALRLALDLPERVAALKLVAATPRFVTGADWPHATPPATLHDFASDLAEDYRGTLLRFLALQARGSATAREDVRRLRERVFEHGEPDHEALARGLEWLAGSDLRPELADLAVPVHFIGGERDNLVPAAALEEAAGIAPRGRVTILPGAGHAPFLSHPEAFREALDG
ncbi:MAG: pimeloyl-ACP methyl ester esterase BioH [Thiohalospira sp.]